MASIKIPNEKSVLDHLVEALGLKTAAAREALKIALENTILLDQKQQDYGSKNISEFGAYGCIVRMSDKFERMKNLYKNKRRRAVNESIRDSFRDFSNYGTIALMCETGKWPDDSIPPQPMDQSGV